ncbi:hypothetical protein M0802_000435 [Mischocyttarus mexicanus]|nr:hypothetical protein M0802_000435 [Mischocyttarus mexicanus]
MKIKEMVIVKARNFASVDRHLLVMSKERRFEGVTRQEAMFGASFDYRNVREEEGVPVCKSIEESLLGIVE